MNIPQIPSAVDLIQFGANLSPKLAKDERRIHMFVADIPNVTMRLLVTNPTQVDDFLREAGALMVKFTGALGKISWNNMGDPFKNARNDARKLAAKWDMSEALRKELG